MSIKLLPRDHPSRSRLPRRLRHGIIVWGAPKCGRVARGGGRVLPGGVSLPYRSIGMFEKKFAEILKIFGIWLRRMAQWEAPSVCDKPRYRPDTSMDCK